MTFLNRILETKRHEVEKLYASKVDLRQHSFLPACRGFKRHIANSPFLAVVAEIKKASPSKGLIAENFRPVEQATVYAEAGAAAISVLTDETYFLGSIQDLTNVRAEISLPILRKDFIIDEVQIDEARIAGADAVLLIAAALQRGRLAALSAYAQSLGLDVLLEVHNVGELDAAFAANPSVLGINNRNLHTFEVSLETTATVMKEVPKEMIAISESGITGSHDAVFLANSGVRGVLVGESLMRSHSAEEVRTSLARLQVPIQKVVPSS